MADSARSQLQGMAGLHGSKVGKAVKTPVGFGAVTSLFADMRRYFSGSWFEDIDSQQDLNRKAERWKHALSRFSERVIEDAMAEVIVRGDVAAPSLNTIRYLCQKKTDENNSSHHRAAARAARDVAMRKEKSRRNEVFHG